MTKLSNAIEYRCLVNLNLYDSSTCTRLATQAAVGRHLRIVSPDEERQMGSLASLQVCLVEDNYCGWLSVADLGYLEKAIIPYQAIAFTETEISNHLPGVIAFTKAAMTVPNYYLWGGTVAPNYDCSGLIQAAFGTVGIWLPRDSYQQEAFTQSINFEELRSGDLIFFAKSQKVTHVALYLGEGYYIHSSGQEMGRNGIGIDQLSAQGDEVSRAYFQQLRSFGRVVASYQPF